MCRLRKLYIFLFFFRSQRLQNISIDLILIVIDALHFKEKNFQYLLIVFTLRGFCLIFVSLLSFLSLNVQLLRAELCHNICKAIKNLLQSLMLMTTLSSLVSALISSTCTCNLSIDLFVNDNAIDLSLSLPQEMTTMREKRMRNQGRRRKLCPHAEITLCITYHYSGYFSSLQYHLEVGRVALRTG